MKKLIKAGTSSRDIIFEDEYFDFVRTSGIGMQNTPWTGLSVISKGLAEKHVVEIRLNPLGWVDFVGDPVDRKYKDAYVAHGMRTRSDTLDETIEYIEVLEDAVEFATAVNEWLAENQ